MSDKIGLFADVHIHPYARFSTISERGLNSWVERALHVLEQVYTECAERSIRDMICLGDLFHAGSRLNTRMLNHVYRFFEGKKIDGFTTTLIAGNHDQLARSGNENALFCLKDVVYQVVSDIMLPLTDNGILMVPYTENYALITQMFAELAQSNIHPRILVGHLAVQGAVVGRHEYQPKEGCHPSWLDYVDLVLLGHYHKRQLVTQQVQYIGSTMAIDFNDANQEKGFTILDPDTLETEFVGIPAGNFRVFEESELPEDWVAQGDYKGDIVRVDHTGELDEEKTRAFMLERGASAVLFKRLKARKVVQRVAADDSRGAVRVYVDDNNDSLNADVLSALGNEIIATVESRG